MPIVYYIETASFLLSTRHLAKNLRLWLYHRYLYRMDQTQNSMQVSMLNPTHCRNPTSMSQECRCLWLRGTRSNFTGRHSLRSRQQSTISFKLHLECCLDHPSVYLKLYDLFHCIKNLGTRKTEWQMNRIVLVDISEVCDIRHCSDRTSCKA